MDELLQQLNATGVPDIEFLKELQRLGKLN